MEMEIEINNGLLKEYEYLFKEMEKKEISQVPVLLSEISKRFNNELSYKVEIIDVSRKLYMLSLVGYRATYGKEGQRLVYRAKGNLIYDGNNILEDGDLNGILERSGKMDLSDYSKLNYKKMIRVINRADINMSLDDERKSQMTKEQFEQLSAKIVDERPYIDMVDFAFDIGIKIEL